MKILKEMIEKSDPVVAKLKYPSKSRKGEFHNIKLRRSGKIECDCEATEFGNECWAIKKAKQVWFDQHGWRYNL